MMKRLNPYPWTEQDEERRSFIGWLFDSHNWVEEAPGGYYKCQWCGATHTSMQGVGPDFLLCEKNPALQKFLLAHVPSAGG